MSPDPSARQTIARKNGKGPAHNEAVPGETHLRRRIRELTANLVSDVLDAISIAATGELGQLIMGRDDDRAGAAELSIASPRRRERERTRERSVPPRSVDIAVAEKKAEMDRHVSQPPAHNDPFDITSPGELLATTDEPSPRSTTVQRPPAEAPSSARPRPSDSVTSLLDGDKEAASERRPTIVLREGERLLSATGSGIVIRRERRVAPPR